MLSYEDKKKQGGGVFLTLNWEKRDITRIRVSYSRGTPRPGLCMFGTLSGTMGLKWFSAPHREKLWRDRWLTLLRSRPSSFISSPPFQPGTTTNTTISNNSTTTTTTDIAISNPAPPLTPPYLTSAPQSLRHHTVWDATTVSKIAPALGDLLLYKTPWYRN